MTVSDLVDAFLSSERPVGVMLDSDVVLAQAVAATRFYSGFSELSTSSGSISANSKLTDSEWALIRPLFLLYVERETAIQLEASRVMGIDAFGRQVAEVSGDIERAEAEMPRQAFSMAIVTV